MKKYLVQFNVPVDASDLMSQTLAKGLQGFLHDNVHTGFAFDWRKQVLVPFSLLVQMTDEEAETLNSMQGLSNLARHIAIEMGQKVASVEVSPYEELSA